MLSTSLVERTIRIMETMPSLCPMDALALAITEENKFLQELLDNRTLRAQKLRSDMCRAVYATQVVKHTLKDFK